MEGRSVSLIVPTNLYSTPCQGQSCHGWVENANGPNFCLLRERNQVQDPRVTKTYPKHPRSQPLGLHAIQLR